MAVVTPFGMIADAVTQAGSDRIEVQALMGPAGVDPHLYRQTVRISPPPPRRMRCFSPQRYRLS